MTDTAPPGGRPLGGELFPVIEMRVFRQRYGPELLRPRALHGQRVGAALRQKLGMRSVLGIAFYPWHDQTTLWWFEQGLLALLAAAGWETTWVTDAHYTFDDERLAELPGRVTVLRRRDEPDWTPPAGHFDAVIALFPSDHATRAAAALGVPLVTFSIKNLHENEAPLVERPPDGTRLWHAFAGSQNFLSAAVGKLARTRSAWNLIGAPFPTNRYYFPLRKAEPCFDALLFGSNSRDYETAFAALARAAAGRITAIANEDDVAAVRACAQRHGLDAEINGPVPHVRLMEVIEQSRIVLNPIVPPGESHYSLSVPFALGRPLVATDLPPVRPFAGPAGLLAPAGDVAAWAACIERLLQETAAGMPHRPALEQGQRRHDVDRFFGSALLAALGGESTPPIS
jgi:hypothetical protein